MSRLLFIVRKFSLWGILFLIVFITCFNIPFSTIYKDINNNIVCLCLIGSIIIYFIIAIISLIINKINRLNIFDSTLIGFPAIMWTPYQGLLDIIKLVKPKKNNKKKNIDSGYDYLVLTIRIIEMLVWWVLFFIGIGIMFNSPNSEVSKAFSNLSNTYIIKKIFILIIIFIVLNIIAKLSLKARSDMWIGEYHNEIKPKGSIGQRYYDRHPEQIPVGCRACGGPYPDCRGSCNIFDE